MATVEAVNLMSTPKHKDISASVLAQFQSVGNDLFLRGLITSHGGNMSMRLNDRIIITRTGCMLGHITKSDLVEASIATNDDTPKNASSEIAVHRAIYKTPPPWRSFTPTRRTPSPCR